MSKNNKKFVNYFNLVVRTFIVSILVFPFSILSCQKYEKPGNFIMMSEGIGENPDEKRRAIVIFDNNLAFYCLENSKTSEYDYYYLKLKNETWEYFRSIILKQFINKKIKVYSSVKGSQKVELTFKIGSITKKFRDINYLILNDEDEKKIYEIFNLIDRKNAKKIDYFPFESELLYEKLNTPPFEEVTNK